MSENLNQMQVRKPESYDVRKMQARIVNAAAMIGPYVKKTTLRAVFWRDFSWYDVLERVFFIFQPILYDFFFKYRNFFKLYFPDLA